MGTWGAGPFDNDAAGDLLVQLEDADPADRVEVVREALEVAATVGGFLDYDDAAAAVAAAAVVARVGDAELRELADGPPLELPPRLVPLALSALDRVVSQESEWRALWAEGPDYDDALGELEAVRSALRRRQPGP